MRRTLKINEKTHLVCIPRSVVEDGMTGRVDAYGDGVSLTLISPSARAEDIKTSLNMVLAEIEHRIDLAKRDSENRGQEGESQ